MKRFLLVLILPLACLLAACGDTATSSTPAGAATAPAPPASAAGHITVQHILVAFKGTLPNGGVTRSQAEAKALAYDLLAKAKSGTDFNQLMQQNSSDTGPGIYSLADTGVPPAQGEYPRDQMVPAFGNVGFTLKPGEIGIADYDPQTSPYGYHIIKRLK